MDATNQATDQLARIMLLGSEYTLRLTGAGAKNLAAMIVSVAKGSERTKGKVRMESLLKSGKPLSVFELRREDVAQFAKEAKRYGILYTVIAKPKDSKGFTVDVLVRADDAARIDRIFEKLKFGTVDKSAIKATVEDIKESRAKKEPNAPLRVDQKSAKAESIIDGLLAKEANKAREIENPTAAKTAVPSPSEHSFEKGKLSAEGIKQTSPRDKQKTTGESQERTSVRKEMESIRKERKESVKTPSKPQQTKHRQPAVRRGRAIEKGR